MKLALAWLGLVLLDIPSAMASIANWAFDHRNQQSKRWAWVTYDFVGWLANGTLGEVCRLWLYCYDVVLELDPQFKSKHDEQPPASPGVPT